MTGISAWLRVTQSYVVMNKSYIGNTTDETHDDGYTKQRRWWTTIRFLMFPSIIDTDTGTDFETPNGHL